MSSQLKTLARSLQAAGYASTGESTTSLLVEMSNRLVEKVWSDQDLKSQVFVCAHVRSNTPALYLVTPDLPAPQENSESAPRQEATQEQSQPVKRKVGISPALELSRGTDLTDMLGIPKVIFCFDKANKLRYHVHNGKKWVEKPFKGIETPQVHPNSKLGGIIMPSSMMVIYQAPSGSIIPIIFSDKTELWNQDPAIEGKAALGSALSATLFDAKFYVFFTGEDECLHYQVLDFQTGKWQGMSENVPHSHFQNDCPSLFSREGYHRHRLLVPVDDCLTDTHSTAGGAFPNSKLQPQATAMAVTHEPETHLIQALALSGNALVLVTSGGENKELGTLKGDVFTPNKTAEDSYTFNIWGNNFGTNNWGSNNYGGNYGNYSSNRGWGYGLAYYPWWW
ncbi:hypothetical protein S7711_00123 [Stachybotrys chartarum IBT 7711]|uniref:Fucose-specific lectin n=1 Tax=Stachybotrys chartarum (strain CBS 109288 / IBT 7711) TaxID=1280523 RepID=A0A084B3I0_STACB|nr:hypothetical protein S7711_00123 [Stachybotrys chartarum IBT 7711]